MFFTLFSTIIFILFISISVPPFFPSGIPRWVTGTNKTQFKTQLNPTSLFFLGFSSENSFFRLRQFRDGVGREWFETLFPYIKSGR